MTTYYITLKATTKGIEGYTIMVQAPNKTEARRIANNNCGTYHKVSKVQTRDEMMAEAGNHGVR